ncbi:hypothetical protein C4D60_Mb06t12850 [Musa balbisiana]|uniref:Uncharacterized protein n=1 Tax=Musa balbisiana TaxID=52838 RepID=A0A4S8IML0_MUSBA|nr:hypothetical protein C4D60_Mb06t12850 [Musa balbisiana]
MMFRAQKQQPVRNPHVLSGSCEFSRSVRLRISGHLVDELDLCVAVRRSVGRNFLLSVLSSYTRPFADQKRKEW